MFVWSVFLERTNTNPKHASLFAFSRSVALALWGAYLASLLAGEGWGFNTATPEFARVKQVGSPPSLPVSCSCLVLASPYAMNATMHAGAQGPVGHPHLCLRRASRAPAVERCALPPRAGPERVPVLPGSCSWRCRPYGTAPHGPRPFLSECCWPCWRC